MAAVKREPRCPECGWTLEFRPAYEAAAERPDLGVWEARCWNPSCSDAVRRPWDVYGGEGWWAEADG